MNDKLYFNSLDDDQIEIERSGESFVIDVWAGGREDRMQFELSSTEAMKLAHFIVEHATIKRFDDIPIGKKFADKFGRLYTKKDVGHASCHGVHINDRWHDAFDLSREYEKATEDDLEDTDMWRAGPYFIVPNSIVGEMK